MLVVASPDTPLLDLLPQLRAVERAGFHELGVISVRPREATVFASLGRVPRTPRCCVTRLHLDPQAPPLSALGTWSRVLDAASSATAFAASLRRESSWGAQ